MDAWVRSGTPPPASRYPRIDDGTLVPFEKYALPPIPHLNRPHEATEALRLDFGLGWQTKRILTLQPPKVGPAFPVMVPQVDADGNERDGVRLPEITVPMATYTAWNMRDPSIGAPDQRVSFEASYVPFAKTMEERLSAKDPRRSVAERYANRYEYLTRYATALDQLVKENWILDEDRGVLQHRAEEEWEMMMGTGSTN
jgi:hypothetical protein